jgi:glycosyltransferase involved in cell wall biosynthesis
MKPPIENLIIVSPGFPKDDQDTACLPAQQLFVKTLNRIYPQTQVTILALQYPPHRDEYTWRSSRVIPIDGLSYWKVFRPLLWRRALRKLEQFFSSKNTAVLSFWLTDTALIGKRFARKYRLCHKCWVMGQDARRQNPYAQWVALSETELIVLSEFMADEFFRNHGKRPAAIIPLGIDPGAFQPDAPQDRTIDVLGVGSLIPLKRYDIFVDVVAALKKSRPDIQAILCGWGPEEAQIRKKIRALDLEKNITFTGEIPHATVLSIMQKSKILLHPSEYEGYSSACLEALYAGCHVVSFTRAEHRDIKHWHVVSTTEQMIAKASTLLNETDFSPVLVHSMEDSAREIMSEIMKEF